jgi:subtilisin family serine protease
MKAHSHFRWIFKGVFLFLITAGCQNKKYFITTYSTKGVMQTVTISLDSIGIVLKAKTDTNNLKSRLSKEGFEYYRNVNDQFIIAKTIGKKSFSQQTLLQTAKNISRANKDLIEAAGLVMYRDNIKTPFFLTDEITMEFKSHLTQKSIDSFIQQHELEIIQQNPYHKQQIVAIPKKPVKDIFKKIFSLHDSSYVLYATPNLLVPIINRSSSYLDLQWHIKNSGVVGDVITGVDDADCDADLAWNFSRGDASTIITVIDDGFEMFHPDLRPGFAINESEINGTDNHDDDLPLNNKNDDSIGWNFHGCNAMTPFICGSADINAFKHGTAAAGVAGAINYTEESTSGICPNCSILPLEYGSHPFAIANAFDYARIRGAKIISCSFNYFVYPSGMLDDQTITGAIKRATDAGIVVCIAAANEPIDHGNLNVGSDWTILPEVISVSRSNNFDLFDDSGYGDSVDVLAPSYHETRSGSLGILTTDLLGNHGFNDEDGSTCGYTVPIGLDYTSCFYGTSASTPLVAGIAGLILSLDPRIQPKQVQYLLQDCTDKIDTTRGHYSKKNGRSNFDDLVAVSVTGYGRVNAYESAKIAAPVDKGGRGGVDIFLRDNILDWGNTEQPSNVLFNGNPRETIGHWKSQDIKVDAPNGIGSRPTNSMEFEDFLDESPMANQTNKVYVRVHNRGYRPAANVNVKLYWVYGGTTLPLLWGTFPQDDSTDPTWHFLGNFSLKDLGYSGTSVAYTGYDLSQIATFDFIAPQPVPGQRNHYCLVALIDSPQDPLNVPELTGITSLDVATPCYNNITHRNYSIIPSTDTDTSANTLLLNNPYAYPVSTLVKLEGAKNLIRRIDNIYVDCVFVMRPKETRRITIYFNKQPINHMAEITVRQEIILNEKKKRKVIGGYSFIFTQ